MKEVFLNVVQPCVRNETNNVSLKLCARITQSVPTSVLQIKAITDEEY